MTWIYPKQVGWSLVTRHLAFFFPESNCTHLKQYITVYILISQPLGNYESLNRILMWLISQACIDIWKSSVPVLRVLKRLSKSWNCIDKVAWYTHWTNPSHLPVTCQKDKQMLSGSNKQTAESWSINKSMIENTVKEKMQICSPAANEDLSVNLSV